MDIFTDYGCLLSFRTKYTSLFLDWAGWDLFFPFTGKVFLVIYSLSKSCMASPQIIHFFVVSSAPGTQCVLYIFNLFLYLCVHLCGVCVCVYLLAYAHVCVCLHVLCVCLYVNMCVCVGVFPYLPSAADQINLSVVSSLYPVCVNTHRGRRRDLCGPIQRLRPTRSS